MREFLIKSSLLLRKHWKVETSHAPALVVVVFLFGAIAAGGNLAGGYNPQSTKQVSTGNNGPQTLGAQTQAQTPKIMYTPPDSSAEPDKTSVLGETTPPAPAPTPTPAPQPTPEPMPIDPPPCKPYPKDKDPMSCYPPCKPCVQSSPYCPLNNQNRYACPEPCYYSNRSHSFVCPMPVENR